MRLTSTYRLWGLRFLNLGDVQGLAGSYKRVYCICGKLELDVGIKPKKRIIHHKPDTREDSKAIHQVWSMDFISNSLRKL